MRQTGHFYMATVAAALVMSCALPYATRANLDQDGFREVAGIDSQMPAAAPVEFVTFPRGTIYFQAKWWSIDLSMTTPQDFLALSESLRKDTGWPSVAPPVRASRAATQSAIRSNARKSAHALPGQIEANIDRIVFNKPVLPPVAFVRFCMRYPDDCKASPTGLDRAPVPLTKARLGELAKVNDDVNRLIKPEANLGGVLAEEWLVAPHHGDCNDYAVTKRHELLARGWPSYALLLTEVVVTSGEHHLVLVVRTNEDDFVLDNLSANVRSISQTAYELVRGQQIENPKFWSTINIARADRVAMNSR